MNDSGVIILAIVYSFVTVGFSKVITILFPQLLSDSSALMILAFGFYFGITALTILIYDLFTNVEKIAEQTK